MDDAQAWVHEYGVWLKIKRTKNALKRGQVSARPHRINADLIDEGEGDGEARIKLEFDQKRCHVLVCIKYCSQSLVERDIGNVVSVTRARINHSSCLQVVVIDYKIKVIPRA